MTLDELKRLAEVATPGPWEVGSHPAAPMTNIVRPILMGAHVRVLPKHGGGHVSLKSADNARLIAAANPATVLALVAVAEAAEVYVSAQHKDPMSVFLVLKDALTHLNETMGDEK